MLANAMDMNQPKRMYEKRSTSIFYVNMTMFNVERCYFRFFCKISHQSAACRVFHFSGISLEMNHCYCCQFDSLATIIHINYMLFLWLTVLLALRPSPSSIAQWTAIYFQFISSVIHTTSCIIYFANNFLI